MQEFIKVPATKRSLLQRKPIFGIGINDVSYQIYPTINGKRVMFRAYNTWSGMLERCYDKKFQSRRKTYIGCSVCDEWLSFSNFADWYKDKYVSGFDLDKDIKVKGNKIYSPKTCLFVPPKVNNLLIDCAASRGAWPVGVHYEKERCKYRAMVSTSEGRLRLGRYDTPEEAHHAYKIAKNEQIRIAMNNNPDIACYLEQHLYPLD